jgi:hypothetical protein
MNVGAFPAWSDVRIPGALPNRRLLELDGASAQVVQALLRGQANEVT